MIVGLFSMGIVGLSIAVAAYTSSIEMFMTIRSTVQLYLSFFSTLFYPVSVFPRPLDGIVATNLMTWAVEAFRSLPETASIESISILIGPSLAFAGPGMLSYLWHAKM